METSCSSVGWVDSQTAAVSAEGTPVEVWGGRVTDLLPEVM